MRFASLVLDLDACTLARQSGEAIPLTRGEFTLLRVFVTRPGRVVGRDALLDAMANRRFEPFDRSVDVLIGRLRRKIERDPKEPRLIVTVPGEGYRFDGLTKTALSDQKLTDLSPHSDWQALEHDAQSSAPSDQRIESKPSAEAKPALLATPVDQTRPPAPRPRFGFVAFAAAIVPLVLLASAGGWVLFEGRPTIPPHAPIFRSWRSRSPISPAILPKTVSSTASPKTLRPSYPVSPTALSSRATPPSATRAETSTPKRLARSSAFATRSKVPWSATRAG